MSEGLQDILNPDDRVLLAGWVLPPEGPLTEQERRAALGNFQAYVRKQKLSLPDVAEQVGTPRVSTIRELLKGVCRENADAYVRVLNTWVEAHARRAVHVMPSGFVETWVAKQVGLAARLTRENGCIGLVYGPSGIGKTRCALAVQQTTPGAIYLRVNQANSNARTFISALAGKIESLDYARQPEHSLFGRAVDRLRDSHRLLLIDEAHSLARKALAVLRDLHDEAGLPILLIATKELHERILADAVPDKGQLYSRVGVTMNLVEGRDMFAGGKPLFTVEQIIQMFQTVPIRLAKDAGEFLARLGNMLGCGSLRECKRLLQNAARRARTRQALGEEDAVTVSAANLEWVERTLKPESTEQAMTEIRRTFTSAVAM